MNFDLDRELLLRCHRWEQLQREAEVHRHRQSQLADPRSTPLPKRRWRLR